MSDDGLDGALGEGTLSGFELQFEPEWMHRCPADGQLALRFARQDTAGQQAKIGRLSRVTAPRYPSPTAQQKAGPPPGGGSRFGVLRWIAQALAVFVCVAAAGCSGWQVAGGDSLVTDLPDWLTVSTDSAQVGASNRASLAISSQPDGRRVSEILAQSE